MEILFIIPARGGSKGIPKKNIRCLNDKPLISYSIEKAKKSRYNGHVVVSTDNAEIASNAENLGADVVMRPENISDDITTLDPVINHCTIEYEKIKDIKFDIIITLQPTSPLLTSDVLDAAIDNFIKEDHDSLISAINSPHLAWGEKDGKYYPLYEERKNRQELPKYFLETGAFFITKRKYVTANSRMGRRISIFEVPSDQSVDIDTYDDWYVAESRLNRKNILIRVDGYNEIGLGHIYRCTQIAYALTGHNIRFVLSEKFDLGIEKIKGIYYPYDIISENKEIHDIIKEHDTDIVINDILDTDAEYVKGLKEHNVRVVNFEDLGEGSKHADAVINALYEESIEGSHYYWGSDYYCIRSEFITVKPKAFSRELKEILVLFGGTDPSDLSLKILNIIKNMQSDINYTFILGKGYKDAENFINTAKPYSNIKVFKQVNNMSEHMRKADLAISSQGRTMYELACLNVPTVILAQNKRELHHKFGYINNGFLNFGLGEDASDEMIEETLSWLINHSQIRRQMHEQTKQMDLAKGISRVIKIILFEE